MDAPSSTARAANPAVLVTADHCAAREVFAASRGLPPSWAGPQL